MIKVYKQKKSQPGSISWIPGELSHKNIMTISERLKVVFPNVEYNLYKACIQFSDVSIKIQPLSEEQEEKILTFFKFLLSDLLKIDFWYTNFIKEQTIHS